MSENAQPHYNNDGPLDEEIEEIHVDVGEDGLVKVTSPDWEMLLSPEEARLLGEALIDAAADAEAPTE